MPLYEYACGACAHQFEELVFATATPRCPQCDAPEVHRLMSVVAIKRGRAEPTERPAPSACGTCGDPRGPGACSMS